MENRVTNVFSKRTGFAPRFDSESPHDRGEGGARLVWLFIAFALPLLAVAARLVQLQCFLADDYVAAFETTSESLEPIPSIDGRIYAGDGRVLVEDVERYHISVHYRWLEDPPNEHWVTRQALSGLTRAERRKRAVVDARRQQILTQRAALWARLAELSGSSSKILTEKRAVIQQRVERIAARLAESQSARENEVAAEAPTTNAGGSPMQRVWHALAAAVTTPPRREADEPIIAREALDYHLVIQDVPLEVRAQIEAHPRLYPGVRVGSLSRRVYYDSPFAPHVVGTRVPVTAAELRKPQVDPASSDSQESTADSDARDPLDYQPGDRIGRTGVEAAYDSHLRGLRGLRRIMRNRYGEVVREETVRSPHPGGSIELTLNTVVQQKMERLLDAALHRQPGSDPPAADAQLPTGGAIVALEVQSGAVFVMASAPRFDLGPSGVPDSKTWQQLNDDPLRPLFHRAIQSALPPGSVFKVLSAVALLQSRKVDPDERFECGGYLDQPDRFRCAIYSQQKIGHGPVDLTDALSRSCNVYFFHAADRIGPQPIVEWAERFAFGRSTGIDLPFEKVGHLPDPDGSNPGTASAKSAPTRWHRGDTRTLAVGQSSLTATPLQIARMMAAVANGGDLITPFVARRSGPRLADEDATSSLSRRVPIPGLAEGTLGRIRVALAKTVSDPAGTGYQTVRSKEISIAGKTGTAQAGKGQADHGWFAGYAPADNPRVAFAVVLEHAGSSSKSAGPLARQLVEALVADGVLQPERVTLRE
ncbi:MAG TPA: penicillin-binding transpeptidase domain-containing protein [Planctomycetaceae bacterium]|jgi:penicillin-binding protein 2|nr:penicillin-binding transpeptidase domain-containing protein [Planctomycetaceae bacterium]